MDLNRGLEALSERQRDLLRGVKIEGLSLATGRWGGGLEVGA